MEVQETVDQLDRLRHRLVALKTDRSKFLSRDAVVEHYSEFETIVESGPDPQSNGELCETIQDILLIFSLGLLTIGLSREAPATYAILVVVKPLLEHLTRTPNFTTNEVQVIERRLDEISGLLDAAANSTSEGLKVGPRVIAIIGGAVTECRTTLVKVRAVLDTLTPNENMAYSQILHLRRDILSHIVSPDFEPEQLRKFRDKVDVIEAHLTGGTTDTSNKADGTAQTSANERVADGNSTLSKPMQFQLHCCKKFCRTFSDKPYVASEAESSYFELCEMVSNLQVFLITHRWTLRETDLYRYLKELRVFNDQVWAWVCDPDNRDPVTNEPAPGIILPLFLVRKCYAIIYRLLDSAEPVTEALVPVFNQLNTTRRCLAEVKQLGGVSNLRELYPYQMKLASLDNLREQGKFMVDDDVPAGQGILNSLLAECFDLVYDLQIDLAERTQNDGDYAEDLSELTLDDTPLASDLESEVGSEGTAVV